MGRTVPGEGPVPCSWCVIGSHPGRDEERQGRPFVGLTGRELERYLAHIGLERGDVYLTNLVKERPLDDSEIPDALVQKWAPDLIRDLERVKPDIVLACSAVVTDWITQGTEYEGLGLEMLHGLAFWHHGLGCWVIPAYHPASGLHESRAMLSVLRDVEAFGRAIQGDLPLIPVDEHPLADYLALPWASAGNAIRGWYQIGLDSEGSKNSPWSLQVSGRPGTGYLVQATNAEGLASIQRQIESGDPHTIYVHHALHDLPVCRAMGITLPPDRTVDTMVVAYQLCDEPQGLKPLAFRHCGMRMKSYEEVVAPAQEKLALDYLEAAHLIDWGPAVPVKVFRNGVEKDSKPWSINRRLENILANYRGVKPRALREWFSTSQYPLGEVNLSPFGKVDLWARWHKVGQRKDPLTGAMVQGDEQEQEQATAAREMVERELGPMPQASLADIPFEDALYYACRDADAEIRVAPALMKRHRETLK